MNKKSYNSFLKNVLLVIISVVLLSSLGCQDIKDDDNATAIYDAFVTTTDYFSGGFYTIKLDTTFTSSAQNNMTIHSDSVVRYFKDKIFIIERMGKDNIIVLDTENNLDVITQYSVGNGSNPQDIAFAGAEKAYISRLNDAKILIVNPLTGTESGTIDLSSYADPDGLPEVSEMAVVGNKLYVAVQRTDKDNWYAPTDKSYVVVINTDTDTVEKAIELAGKNPYTLVYNSNTNKIYVSNVGSWGIADGGVEVIDVTTNETLGIIIPESVLGGDASYIEILSADKGYAVITDSSYNTVLISFNPAKGEKTADVFVPAGGGFVLDDITSTKDGKLLLSDRTSTAPGVRVFDTDTDNQIKFITVGQALPPARIVIME